MQELNSERRQIGRTRRGHILWSTGEVETDKCIYPSWEMFKLVNQFEVFLGKSNELLPIPGH